MYQKSDGKRRSRRRSVSSKRRKCNALLSKKVGINIHEGIYKNKSQAIAVAYSQVRKRHPSCRRILGKGMKRSMRRSKKRSMRRKMYDGAKTMENTRLKQILDYCIQIVKSQRIPQTWCPAPEDFVTYGIYDNLKKDEKIEDFENLPKIIVFLKKLHSISIAISSSKIEGVDYPNLIKDFRENGITEDLVSDKDIEDIKERWKKLAEIAKNTGKLSSKIMGR